ncbi:MAG: hypothetical protein KJO73_05635 [Croceitalea sp.]|nr:hypothetical protein [Croceitalea sp.]
MNFTSTSQKIAASKPIDFSNIFNGSINLFQKVWLQGFLTIVLTILLILPFYVLFYLPMIIAGIDDPDVIRAEDLPDMAVMVMAVLFPFLMLAIMTISLAFNAAFLRISKQKDLNELGSDDYFYFFKNGYLGKTFVLALYALGVSLLGLLACFIGVIYVMVPVSLFPAFLAFNDELSAGEIVKASFALGNKNWLVIFGLLIVLGLIAELGVLLCVVGVFFTAMLSKIPVYFIYKDVFGFEQPEQLSD